MDIRLVAVDLDGTLLRSDKTLSGETIDAVALAAERGVEVAFCTGRSHLEFAHLARQLPSVRYAVAGTGAEVIDCRNGEALFLAPLAPALLREARRRLRPFDALFELFQDGHVLLEQEKLPLLDAYLPVSFDPGFHRARVGVADLDARFDLPTSKIHLFFRDTPTRDAARDAVRGLDATVCCSCGTDLEIMAPGVDKGTGLRWLAEHLGLARRQILAVGDSDNDQGMLDYAGVRAVMANGDAALRAAADLIPPDNDHDGVACLLRALARGQLPRGYMA